LNESPNGSKSSNGLLFVLLFVTTFGLIAGGSGGKGGGCGRVGIGGNGGGIAVVLLVVKFMLSKSFIYELELLLLFVFCAKLGGIGGKGGGGGNGLFGNVAFVLTAGVSKASSNKENEAVGCGGRGGGRAGKEDVGGGGNGGGCDVEGDILLILISSLAAGLNVEKSSSKPKNALLLELLFNELELSTNIKGAGCWGGKSEN
jgi:hypothetical protein